MRMFRRLLLLVALFGWALVACRTDDVADAPATTTAPEPLAATASDPITGTVTVFAAASLTDAFTEVAAAFEAEHPEVTVTLNFAGSSALREQILGGAPADVYASANQFNMDQVIDGEAAVSAVPFVANSLAIVVPVGNPADITGLADFARDDLLLGLCAEEVPCGSFGREALAKADVVPDVDTNEPDVRALLTKVASGDLDAGIVYVTDIASASPDVESIAIPTANNVIAKYPIATLTAASNPVAAQAFVDFVLSDRGQGILLTFSFAHP